jgi:hypothetical protein
MSTALSFPTITGVTGAPHMPDLSEAANIQTALKYLYYGSTGIAANTDGIYGALQRLYVGDPTLAGNVTITGDLTVNGTTTTINTATLDIEDKEISLGKVTTPSNTTANGGGIRLLASPTNTDKTIIWDSTNANWTTSENWNLATGKTLKINNVDIASGTGAALVLGANASTTIAIGANGGTATILNPTVTLTNATALNINGTSPSIVTSSTGTASVFNTNAATINVGNAATTASIANAATTLSIGNTTTTAQTVNLGTASTGASTYNLATGATATATTKTVNIGTGGATGSTTNISLGAASATANSTINLNGKSIISSTTVSGNPTSGLIEYDGSIFYATPKANNTTYGRGLLLAPSILVQDTAYTPTAVSSTGATVSAEYYALGNRSFYLLTGQSYLVEFYIAVAHTGTIPASGAGSAVLEANFRGPTNTNWFITANTAPGTGSSFSNATTQVVDFYSNTGSATTLKTISSNSTTATTITKASILQWSGIIQTNASGVFGPSLKISATGTGSTNTSSITVQAGSYCKITPLGSGTAINIGGWA